MRVLIATLLITATLGEAYSQERRRRNPNQRVERGQRTNQPRQNGRVRPPRDNDRREQARREQSRREQARREQARREQARREQARREQARREQARREQARREQARSEQARREQARREQARREQARRAPNRDPRRRGISIPAGRVRRPHARPNRNYYGTRHYHRPHQYSYRPYRSYRHAPMRRAYRTARRYQTRFDYFHFLRQQHRRSIYLNWVLFPSSRVNGYVYIDQYPYYVHNGYRHRYSYEDSCQYQLIDSFTHEVVSYHFPRICSQGYDACALERDSYNARERENRYFCAETVRDDDYDYSQPTYDYDEYEDYGHTTCYDYDPQTGVCYDYQ